MPRWADQPLSDERTNARRREQSFDADSFERRIDTRYKIPRRPSALRAEDRSRSNEPRTAAGQRTWGRTNLEIHGERKPHPGSTSTGCIILKPQIRDMVLRSLDHILTVRRCLSVQSSWSRCSEAAQRKPRPSAWPRLITWSTRWARRRLSIA